MAFANQFAAHQLTIKHLAGKQYRTDAEVISAVEDFFRIRMRASIPQESKRCNTDGRSVWIAGETILKLLQVLKTNTCTCSPNLYYRCINMHHRPIKSADNNNNNNNNFDLYSA